MPRSFPGKALQGETSHDGWFALPRPASKTLPGWLLAVGRRRDGVIEFAMMRPEPLAWPRVRFDLVVLSAADWSGQDHDLVQAPTRPIAVFPRECGSVTLQAAADIVEARIGDNAWPAPEPVAYGFATSGPEWASAAWFEEGLPRLAIATPVMEGDAAMRLRLIRPRHGVRYRPATSDTLAWLFRTSHAAVKNRLDPELVADMSYLIPLRRKEPNHA